MTGDSAQEAWARSVRSALSREDFDQLSDLFMQARQTWGPEQASRMWLETVSAFDANAITG